MRTNGSIWVGAVALAGVAASSAMGQIVNTKHNFSGMAWSGGEICKPCHTPHNAIDGMPRLWNHALTTATYQMHGGTGTAEVDLDYRSRMCMSCHDGTVALDSFGGQTGTSFIAGRAKLGEDLENDHPIGSDAVYPPDPLPPWWNNAFQPASSLPSSLRLRDWVDPGGVTRQVVSCTTCHNPHGRGGFPKMLTMSNAASAACLGCHIK